MVRWLVQELPLSWLSEWFYKCEGEGVMTMNGCKWELLRSPCPFWWWLRMTPARHYITREDVARWQACQLRHIWRQHQTGFHPAQEVLMDRLPPLVLRNVLDAL